MKNNYPKYSDFARKGEQGVHAISRVINEFGWIFKRNHQEFDFGIDAQIEIVGLGGFVTGQVVAVQIKYGKAFFKEKTSLGYVYRGERKHFNYLCNYPVPTLIMICEPQSGEIYWEEFTPNNTSSAGENWKMTIPFSNKLKDSKEKIVDLIGPIRDSLGALEKYWSLNKFILGRDYILYTVSVDEVLMKNVGGIEGFFHRLRSNKELAMHCQGKVEIGFDGYDSDPRELYVIKEVRDFISLANDVLPDLFFFFRAKEPAHALKLFPLALAELSFPEGQLPGSDGRIKIAPDLEVLASFFEEKFVGLNDISEWLGLDEQQEERISYEVMEFLMPGFEGNADEND